jgi:hypothetical protein
MWKSYKVLLYYPVKHGTVDLADMFVTGPAQYGISEFQPGVEEFDEAPAVITSNVATTPGKGNPVLPVVGSPIDSDRATAEGFSVLQIGVFVAVVFGCVAGYRRISRKLSEKFREKSAV